MRFLSLLAPLLGLSPLATATPQGAVRLNAPLAQTAPGSVDAFDITPDGSTVVYVAHDGTVSDPAVYSAPFDGSSPAIDLTASLPDNTFISSATVLSSGDRVLIRASLKTGSTLLVASIDGSTPLLHLNPGISSGFFRLTPDETHVVFDANPNAHIVPLDGSAAPMPIGSLTLGSNRPSFFTPDGLRAIYSLNVGNPTIHSAPLDTPDSYIEHLTNYTPGSQLWGPQGLTGDGQFVIYKMEPGGDGAQLYANPIDGSGPSYAINPALTQPSMEVDSFKTVPGSNLVVFLSNHQNLLKYQLYSRPADLSSSPKKLNASLPTNADVQDFEVSSDGLWVAYEAPVNNTGVLDLFVVSVNGGSSTQLNNPYVAGGDTYRFAFSPDDQWMVFMADGEVDGRNAIYAAPIDGSQAAVQLNANGPAASGNVVDFLEGANGHVFFRASSPDGLALYSVKRDGSEPARRVSGPNAENGAVLYGYQVSDDGDKVIYRSDENLNNHFEIFGAEFDDTEAAALVSQLTLVTSGDVSSFRISPDSQWVVYSADQDTDNFSELYAVPADGSADPVAIADMNPSNSFLGPYEISPDSQWVVFEGNRDSVSSVHLYRVPIDGSALPERINSVFPIATKVDRWSLEDDFVVYTLKSTANFGKDIFSRRLDLSTPEVRLNTQQQTFGDVNYYEVNSTRTRVVFRGDLGTNGIDELFVVPIDGSAQSVRLHPVPVLDGELYDFDLSPDGNHVALTMDLFVDQEFHVYSRPLDLSTPLVQVSRAVSTTGDSYNAGFSADSTQVNYLSYETDEVVVELHAADLDGGNPLQLSAPMVADGDVLAHLAAPGGITIYRADQELDGQSELYWTAGQGVTKLSPALPGDGDVGSFSLHPNGKSVFFLADDLVDGDSELFSSRLTLTPRPLRINGPMATGGDAKLPFAFRHGMPLFMADQNVVSKEELFYRLLRNADPALVSAPMDNTGDVSRHGLTPDGEFLIYTADLDEDGVFELFSRRMSISLQQND